MEFTKGFDSNYRIERQKEIDELFRTTINYYAGGEIKIPFLPIYGRAGAMYLQSPYADDPMEFDKKYLTVGGGYLFENNLQHRCRLFLRMVDRFLVIIMMLIVSRSLPGYHS